MKPLLALLALAATLRAAPPEPKFRAVTIDDKIQIGYGVAVADVDGDKRPDIVLADKKQFVWYQNPGQPPPGAESFAPSVWSKFILAENLTKNDNVCLAAQDIDGDGKCEIAVGAEWNPGDTVNSGAVFYLIPPEDRTQKWEAVKFPSVEPTTHRMKWIKVGEKEWRLVVVPLHGRGNKNGEGAPVKVLLYHKPADVRSEWKSEIVDESMHATHNFDIPAPQNYSTEIGAEKFRASFLVAAGREGLLALRAVNGEYRTKTYFVRQPSTPGISPRDQLVAEDFRGAGEVRFGLLEKVKNEAGYFAAVEPMHGNSLAIYIYVSSDGSLLNRRVLTDKLTEGHALACGDLFGTGSDQIVVGWRGTPGKEGSTIGVHLWTALDEKGEKWRDTAVDDGGMACEDLVLADLNGDGKLDIVASGRATHNVKVYFNETR